MNVLNLETRNDVVATHSEDANAYAALSNGLIKSASTSTCCANENVLLKEALRNYSYPRNNDYKRRKYLENVWPILSAVKQETSAFNAERIMAEHKLQVKLRLHRVTHFSDSNLNEIGLSASSRYRKPATDVVRPSTEYGAKCPEFSSHRNLDAILVNRSGNDGNAAILNFASVNKHVVIRNRVSLAGTSATNSGHRKSVSTLEKPTPASSERRPSNDNLKTAAAGTMSRMHQQSNSAPMQGGYLENGSFAKQERPVGRRDDNVPETEPTSQIRDSGAESFCCSPSSNDRTTNNGPYLETGSFAKQERPVGRRDDNVPETEPISQIRDSGAKSFCCSPSSNDRTTNNGRVKYGVLENENETSSQPMDERRRTSGIFVRDLGERNVAEERNNAEDAPPPFPPNDEKRPRRSSSLKTPKLNDSTPAQKKIVRFADALGLDLADIRTFLDELPSIPKSAYNDLQNDEPAERVIMQRTQYTETAKTLVPMFKQPHTSLHFLDRIRDNFVVLEFAKINTSPICSIGGTVRVRNLDFCKSVYVRYTTDNWRTFNELQAAYVPDSCDGFSDKFTFAIYVYEMNANQRVELAVRFHCGGSIYWDNNNGSNYVFQCLPSAPVTLSYFQLYAANDDVSNSFV